MGTPAPAPPHPVLVHGGSGGIVAQSEQIRATAAAFAAAAVESLGSALDLHHYLVHPAVLQSAAFDPAGYAAFETRLLLTLDGPRGLGWTGTQSGLLELALRAAAASYEGADRIVTRLHDEVVGLAALPSTTIGGQITLARTHDPVRALEAVGVHDPEVLDAIADLLGVPTLIAAVAAGLPDGTGVATDLGVDAEGIAGRPPRNLVDVVHDLARRNDDPHHGAVDVRIITLADGSRRVIVDITGTKSWALEPSSDVADVVTNGRALTGQHSAYEQGVLHAMRRAGVRKSDDVMLVGHSQGGLVAVTTARDAVRSGEFNVTHVVTAGSPVGLTVGQVPATVKVLALENSRDVVPHLDGRANPDRVNVTTVSSSRGDATIGGDHGIGSAYIPVADDAQRSGAASVDDFLTSADGYFRGTHVTTHTYQITRQN